MEPTDPLLRTGRKRVKPGTLANYEAGWRRYAEWCASTGRDPLDGDAEQVCEFLVAMYRLGIKPGTLKLWRVAITFRYQTDPALKGKENPAEAPEVSDVLKNITEDAADAGITERQATPLTLDVLGQVLEVSALRRQRESEAQAERRHAEMVAVLPTMFDAMLRGDEMVRARWSDLSTTPHPKSGHYRLAIPKSKTDQTGKGSHAFVSSATFEALQRWRKHPAANPEFICTTRNPNALGQRIRRLGEAAGIKLSGHSARRGGANEIIRNGGSDRQLKQAGRWRKSDTASKYVDEFAAADNGMTLVYGNAPEPEPATEPEAVAAWEFALDLQAKIVRLKTALNMAVALSFDHPDIAEHPEVAAIRAEVCENWPERLTELGIDPPDCERPGCPGMRLDGQQRWCSDRCQQDNRNATKRAERAEQTD
ncbi:MAG: tyrosine-type recombinase/integrase [Acidimicrobiaceae bacterium]|nr:tyrosine-type recombinase/integrase [Acidimicrobiaceae bacterium]